MNVSGEKMSQIPALERGLRVVDLLISNPKGLSYSDIKRGLVDIGDASLARLLKSLLATSHLCKRDDGSYEVGPVVKSWLSVSGQATRERDELYLSQAVKDVSEQCQASVGYVEFKQGHLVLQHRYLQPESISVIEIGSTFKLQSDHAAALAIFSDLKEEAQNTLLQSGMTEFSDRQEFLDASARCKVGQAFWDESRLRPGVSRMARSLKWSRGHGAIFICSTRQQLEQKQALCLELLERLVLEMRGCLVD